MQIGIDARLYNQTGVGRYLRNLLLALSKIDSKNHYTVFLKSEDYHAFEISNSRWRKKRLDIPWHSLKEQILLPKIFSSHHFDVFHFPYFNVPIMYLGKYILTIHDLIVDHFDTGRASTLPVFAYKAKRVGYKIITQIGAKRACHILAISNATKKEILDHYPVDPSNISVTPNALDIGFSALLKSHRSKQIFDFPYILYVGNAYPHKNLERLIQAFEKAKKLYKVKLVLTGDDSYFYPKLKEKVNQKNLGKDIIFFGFANDRELLDLYSFSKCLIIPSLMEGFGLPAIEALTCNVLPVLSDIPAFKDIWGSSLIYFDPEDVQSIKDQIITVLQMDKDVYDKRVKKAKARIANYSWRNTAKKTLEIYQKVHKGVK